MRGGDGEAGWLGWGAVDFTFRRGKALYPVVHCCRRKTTFKVSGSGARNNKCTHFPCFA